MATHLQESQALNFKRWDVLNDKIFANMYSYGSFQAEVDVLATALSGRVEWMDAMLGYLPDEEGIEDVSLDHSDELCVFSLDGKLLNRHQQGCLMPQDIFRQFGRGAYIIKSGSQQQVVVF